MMAPGIGFSLLLIAFSAILTYFLAKLIRVYLLISKFDGPPALPIVGNTFLFKRDQREFFLAVQSVLNEYRHKTGGLIRTWLGPVPTVNVYGAKHMEVILSSSRHIKKGFFYKFLEPWLGEGLVTSSGEKWFHRRKLLTPTFHFSILQNFMAIFNEQSAILVKKLQEQADTNKPVNIYPLITYCVLDILGDTAMGKHINAQNVSDNAYVNAVTRMSELLVRRGKRPWLFPDLVFHMLPDGKEYRKTLKCLHDVTNEMIHERLGNLEKSSTHDDDDNDVGIGKRKRVAFLDLLLQMYREDKTFTLKHIREEVDTFMFAGHDTTAAAVSWALLLLGLNPDIQAKVHAELDEVFGDSDRSVTSDDLSRLSYLTRVVKETLRMIPSVPMIMRTLDEDIILDGKVVPKEATIILCIYTLHHDPEAFPDPERFDPDRFLPENSTGRHPYAYVPFSAGPRNCIGQKFALMEDKVILATLLRKFSVESAQSVDEAKPAGQLILRPTEGKILVKLSSRKQKEI